jgi:hypothetical protein
VQGIFISTERTHLNWREARTKLAGCTKELHRPGDLANFRADKTGPAQLFLQNS